MLRFTNRGNYFTSSLLSDLGYIHGFTTRNTPAIEHIFPTLPLHFMNQVHEATCVKVENPFSETLRAVDGQYTHLNNNVLIVKTADCIPVLYADPKRSVIAASHQGWKGSYLNMVTRMVETLVDDGSNVEDICVAIGPHVGPCCYTIAPGRMHEFGYRLNMYKKKYPTWYDLFIEKRGHNYAINLLQLNLLQLNKVGVKKSNIDYGIFCTSCQNNTFYSHIKDDSSTHYNFIMQ